MLPLNNGLEILYLISIIRLPIANFFSAVTTEYICFGKSDANLICLIIFRTRLPEELYRD